MLSCDKKRKLPYFLFSGDLCRKRRDVAWATQALTNPDHNSKLVVHPISHYLEKNDANIVPGYMLLLGGANHLGLPRNLWSAKGCGLGPSQCYRVLLQGLVSQLPRLQFHGVPGRFLVPSISEMNKTTKSIRGSLVPSFQPKVYLESLVAEGSSIIPTLEELRPCSLVFDVQQPALPDRCSVGCQAAKHMVPSEQPMTLQLLAR
jgi:hypothetical protein